jgi:BolA-like protein 1
VEFIELPGAKQSLSLSRNSGLPNMLKLMKRKALEIAADAGGDSTTSQQSAQEIVEPRAEGMENKRTEFAAFGAQEDERSVADMHSQEGQLEERGDKGKSRAQTQVRGRRRADV